MDTDLRVPVTRAQKDTIREAATAAGMDMAAWIRPILLKAATQETTKSKGKKRRSDK